MRRGVPQAGRTGPSTVAADPGGPARGRTGTTAGVRAAGLCLYGLLRYEGAGRDVDRRLYRDRTRTDLEQGPLALRDHLRITSAGLRPQLRNPVQLYHFSIKVEVVEMLK